jgi:hypothetical protein
MASVSKMFPEYVRLSDGMRSGEIPETQDNLDLLAVEEKKLDDYMADLQADKKPILSWYDSPVAASCWKLDAQDTERL